MSGSMCVLSHQDTTKTDSRRRANKKALGKLPLLVDSLEPEERDWSQGTDTPWRSNQEGAPGPEIHCPGRRNPGGRGIRGRMGDIVCSKLILERAEVGPGCRRAGPGTILSMDEGRELYS